MDSIMSKVAQAYQSQPVQKRAKAVKDSIMMGKAVPVATATTVHTVKEAAEAFVEVLQYSIETGGLPSGVVSAISDITIGAPTIGSDGYYHVAISFPDDRSRDSLFPINEDGTKGYEPIDNLFALYNNGVDHIMNTVYGKNKDGKKITSNPYIPKTGFVGDAKRQFMSYLADEYGVKDIIISDEYEE